MALSLILKNLTASPQNIADLGLYIPASGQADFTNLFSLDRNAPFASTDLAAAVASDLITINDGTSDIAKANAVAYLHKFSVNADSSLVPDTTDLRYCTDAQKTLLGNTAGNNSGDVTLATNPGLAFTSGQTGLSLGTPATVTNATSNGVTGSSHTHAVTGLVVANGAITGATNPKITYDAKGLVTGGAALIASDIPSLDASKITTGVFNIAQIPASALERLTQVTNQAARYALTTASVQNGDTVKQLDTGTMYIVVDDTQLSVAAGYVAYTAGSASSVPWSGVTGTPTTLAGYAITDAVPSTRTVNTLALSSNITLTTANIADSTNARYCTDAQKTVIGNTSGTNSGDVTLATNTGLAFTSGQTGLAIGTPSSITTSSTNTVTTGTHTHAITGFATGAGSASGANTVDVTLATNHGLSLSGQQLSMGAPSSTTSTSTNAVTTTTHTHAIDSTIATTAALNAIIKNRVGFGRSGNVPVGAFLQSQGVQTSATYGVPIVTAGTLFGVAVMCAANVAAGGAIVDVLVNGTSVGTLSITAGQKTAFISSLTVSVSANSWIAVRNATTSANAINNPIVTLEFS